MFMKLPPLQYPSRRCCMSRSADGAVCNVSFTNNDLKNQTVDINPVQLLLLTSRAMGAIMAIVLRRELWRIDFSIPFD